MAREFSLLDSHLADTGADGYLVCAPGDDPIQQYLTAFFAPDPVTTLYTGGDVYLLVSPGEYAQARTESRADTVVSLAEYDIMQRYRDHGRYEAFVRALVDFLEEMGIQTVSVPADFPASIADRLRNDGLEVRPEAVDLTLGGVVSEMRATKTGEEIEKLRAVQSANEAAMATVADMLRRATVDDGVLSLEGAALTVERVKTELEMELLRQGCLLQETILACGTDSAEPHNLGSGSLRADEPIVVDIFPQHKSSKYFGDMTRTFVKGSPGEQIREFHDLTLEAQHAAFDRIEAGSNGTAVYEAACEVFEAAGYPTLRSEDDPDAGFITLLGHGVGLSIHEPPYLGPNAGDLQPGNIVTVEPGLYDPEIGGVRIEDLVVVTEDGFENLNEYPKDLQVE